MLFGRAGGGTVHWVPGLPLAVAVVLGAVAFAAAAADSPDVGTALLFAVGAVAAVAVAAARARSTRRAGTTAFTSRTWHGATTVELHDPRVVVLTRTRFKSSTTSVSLVDDSARLDVATFSPTFRRAAERRARIAAAALGLGVGVSVGD